MSKENQIKLRPCPFCGKDEDDGIIINLGEGEWSFHHSCEKVNEELTIFISVYGKSKEEVAERWNGRADNEEAEAKMKGGKE